MTRRITGCRIKKITANAPIRVEMESEYLSNESAALSQSSVRIGIDVRAIEADLHIHSSITVGIENDHVMKCKPPKTEANRNINMNG